MQTILFMFCLWEEFQFGIGSEECENCIFFKKWEKPISVLVDILPFERVCFQFYGTMHGEVYSCNIHWGKKTTITFVLSSNTISCTQKDSASWFKTVIYLICVHFLVFCLCQIKSPCFYNHKTIKPYLPGSAIERGSKGKNSSRRITVLSTLLILLIY